MKLIQEKFQLNIPQFQEAFVSYIVKERPTKEGVRKILFLALVGNKLFEYKYEGDLDILDLLGIQQVEFVKSLYTSSSVNYLISLQLESGAFTNTSIFITQLLDELDDFKIIYQPNANDSQISRLALVMLRKENVSIYFKITSNGEKSFDNEFKLMMLADMSVEYHGFGSEVGEKIIETMDDIYKKGH